MRVGRILKMQLCLVALVLSGTFANQVRGESFSGAAADAILDVQPARAAAATKRHAASPRPVRASKAAAVSKSSTSARPSGKAVEATSSNRKLKNRDARNSTAAAGKGTRETSDWKAEGAINLDAIKSAEGLTGLLLVGGPALDFGGAGVLASGALQAGLGSAAVWGLVGAVVCFVATGLFASMQPKASGARPGSEPSKSGFSVVGAIAAFILVFCAKLFGFPDNPVNLNSANALDLASVYSNEFGLQCLLPKDILKAKMKEKVGMSEITVNVAGYRRGKDEMMVGYAHLPSFDEMVKAKQAMEGPKLANIANFQNLNAGFSKPQYYFDVNKALDGCVEAAEKRANFKVKYRCPISVQGKLPGREYEGTASHGRLVRGRVFIGYNNYYHAIVVGEPSFVNSNDGYEFLNSMSVH